MQPDQTSAPQEPESPPTWAWKLGKPLYRRLTISETKLAHEASMRRGTLNGLRGQRDSYALMLVSLYLAARQHDPTLTLHDLVAVPGAPEVITLPVALPAEVRTLPPLPGLVGVYLGTSILRRRMDIRAGTLSEASSIDYTTLSRIENAHIHPRMSTLIRLYQALLPHDPTLTLHDLILIRPTARVLASAALVSDETADADAVSADRLLALWERLYPDGQQATILFAEDLLRQQEQETGGD